MHKYTVNDLFKGALPKQYQDQVFWYANKVIITNNGIDLYVSNDNLVAFDNIAKQLEIKSITELSSISSQIPWDTGEKPILVSSGTFLWINNKIVVTQRNANTAYDPLAWTTPAGRCDDTPFRTALKETIEEIHIQSTDKKYLFIPEIAHDFSSSKHNTVYYPTNNSFPKHIKQPLTNTRTWFEGDLIEEVMLWYFYNEKANTLEFRLPLMANIMQKLCFSNPEFFTKTKAVDFTWLKDKKSVPALLTLLKG